MTRIMDVCGGCWEKSCATVPIRQLRQPALASRPGSLGYSALQRLSDLLQRSRVFDRGQITRIPAFTEGLD